MTIEIFLNNVRHAVRNNEPTLIGGGTFGPDELEIVLADIALLQSRVETQAESIRTLDNAREAFAQEVVELRRAKVAAELKAEDMETRYRAESLECNSLRKRIADLAEQGASLRASVAEWKGEAHTQEQRAIRAEREGAAWAAQAAEHGARADKVDAQLNRLMAELGGLTLAQLPNGGYGEALASLYCDIKAGR